MRRAECPSCGGPAPGRAVWSDPRCRAPLVEGSPSLGPCRAAWSEHVGEPTDDLSRDGRAHAFEVPRDTEAALRDLPSLGGMDLAALGTTLPHLHRHAVPRRPDDAHLPGPIWSAPRRAAPERESPEGFAADPAVALGSRLRR